MVERGIWHIPEENISDWDSGIPIAQEDLNSKKKKNQQIRYHAPLETF